MANNPEINPLQAKLTPYVTALKHSADTGNAKAKQVISLYKMYTQCPEVGAATLCEAFLEDWKKETDNV